MTSTAGGHGHTSASNDDDAAASAVENTASHRNSNLHPASSSLNLEDIFGDVLFTPDGDTVFLGERSAPDDLQKSGEDVATVSASRLDPGGAGYRAVPPGGGLYTTQLHDPARPATAMGEAAATTSPTPPPPRRHGAVPPPPAHQLQYAVPAAASGTTATAGGLHPKKRTAAERKMSDQQKSERRERNREHAKRSRIRKKFLLESLQQSVSLLKEENDKLRGSIRSHLGAERADAVMASAMPASHVGGDGLLADPQSGTNKVLDDPDFSFIKALQTAQQNFVVTDPSLPDNPIVYASQGFLSLTGYTLDQILGRNCRFLQGPETDPKSVEKIRKAIEQGQDASVCLLNYRVDGTTFWNQFFIAALRDAAGEVTNYVGVQCKVSDQYAATATRQQDDHDDDDDNNNYAMNDHDIDHDDDCDDDDV